MFKTLIFVSPCLSFAGAEKILCWLASEFSSIGYKVKIINLNIVSNNSNFKRENLDGVEVIELKKDYKKGLNNYYRVKKIVEIAKNNNADAVIAFTRYPCILSVIASKISGIPAIISERGDPYQYRQGIQNKVDFLILNCAQGCVFQTENAMVAYKYSLARRSKVIPNPVFKVDGERWHDTDNFKIISIGRLDNNQKRYDIMIEGFNKFTKMHPEYTLEIFGKGPDEEAIIEIAKNSEVNYKIHFHGLTINASKELLNAKIFLITSDFEGIPNALLEAMAIGMPVVSTKCSPGGAEFLIRDHRDGLLVPCGDSTAIADALSEFATNKNLLLSCAENAFDVTRRFEPDKIFMEWKEYVEKVLNAYSN